MRFRIRLIGLHRSPECLWIAWGQLLDVSKNDGGSACDVCIRYLHDLAITKVSFRVRATLLCVAPRIVMSCVFWFVIDVLLSDPPPGSKVLMTSYPIAYLLPRNVEFRSDKKQD